MTVLQQTECSNRELIFVSEQYQLHIWLLLLPCDLPVQIKTNKLSLFTVGGVSGKGDASDEDDDNEFFDAMEDPAEFITVPADPKYHRLITKTVSVISFFFLS